MYFKRGLSVARVLTKESIRVSVPKAEVKWTPKAGNTFRSFAEYRLKATHQAPLAVKSRATKTSV